MFVESGITDPEKIVIRGCPRMDRFVEQVNGPSESATNSRHQIAYFSSPSGAEIQDAPSFDFLSTSRQVIRALAELARDDPDLQVVIKMKDLHINSQIDVFRDEIRNVAGLDGGLSNVAFETGRMAAHDVLAESTVICAMQSTVVLEAAVAGKPVILPHFKELRAQANSQQVLMYQEYHDLFDVPTDTADLKRIILSRLENPRVDEEIMRCRHALFEEYVSPLAGGATDISIELIRSLSERVTAA